ncbi:MAG TPA: single-stranded DNA-binding protein, partial [Aliarcobacter cryaerophilus]|nr:single-stranded DNA-binding protein [Aliarcobacter cryaerophilus]
YIPSGTAVAKCSIAYTDGYGDKKTSNFMDIILWGKTAEAFNKYCKIGSKVMVSGFPVFETWVDKYQQPRSRHLLRVETMKMLDSKNSDSTPPGHQYQTVRESSSPRENQSTYTRKPSMDATVPEIDIDDEIPFNKG